MRMTHNRRQCIPLPWVLEWDADVQETGGLVLVYHLPDHDHYIPHYITPRTHQNQNGAHERQTRMGNGRERTGRPGRASAHLLGARTETRGVRARRVGRSLFSIPECESEGEGQYSNAKVDGERKARNEKTHLGCL